MDSTVTYFYITANLTFTSVTYCPLKYVGQYKVSWQNKNTHATVNLKNFRDFRIFGYMDEKGIEKDKLIKYWIVGSDDDFDIMVAMFDTKRYSWSLFIGHLMIEKLLKAHFVKVNSDYPPFIHNLLRLAEKLN